MTSSETPPARAPRRILVIANETLESHAVCPIVRARADRPGDSVLVVAPALNTRVRQFFSDEGRARAAAEDRLARSLDGMGTCQVHARGRLGDADPLQALDDVLRVEAVDEAIVVTHPPGRSHWLERDLVGRARERYRLPIAHVVVDLGADPEAWIASPSPDAAALIA